METKTLKSLFIAARLKMKSVEFNLFVQSFTAINKDYSTLEAEKLMTDVVEDEEFCNISLRTQILSLGLIATDDKIGGLIGFFLQELKIALFDATLLVPILDEKHAELNAACDNSVKKRVRFE